MARRTLEETWKHLEERRFEPRRKDGAPWLPPAMPSYDDDELGFEFFRTQFTGDLSELTLPRTYFGPSLLEKANFRDTDLSESRMCWNDFVRCDFSNATLRGCDLRASIYVECNFDGADLSAADLRRGDYQQCTFAKATLQGARLERDSPLLAQLSSEQRLGLVLEEGPGEEPGGG